ncbi:MFS general substrate transporter [Hyaloscypha variabilis F]|uniref:MFS general substrate transporter n=1 Tax=Hyaloscypha variabilis (strain UAMH 11265 / GT02V1 / F) TaxID=1149755 RepID=A0A2J6QVC2_HYAVF|nr:MFS general substrate transporter [Hyaloscypha variabilis F]
MPDSQMQSSSSTLSADQDVPEMEKPTAGDIYGEDDSDGVDNGDGGEIEKQTQDLEKGPSKHAHPTALNWDGPDDPEDPHNWPFGKKLMHIIAPAMISLTASFGSSVISPAFPTLQKQWGISSTVAILPLTTYVLALGLGPVIAAPISETYGRRIVYLVSNPLGAVFTLGAGFSQNIWTLCILRFFAGLTFSPALSIGAGSNADVVHTKNRATASAFYILSPFLGPALGPVIGSFVTVRKSWRWTQWTLIFFAIFSFILTLLTHETYKKTLLLRRLKARGLPPPPSPFPSTLVKFKFFITVTLIRPVHMLVAEPIVGFFSLYVAFNFAVLFAFFAAFPLVFESVYGFDTEQTGLVFIAIGVGCILAVPSVILCDIFIYQPQYRASISAGKGGVVAPEYRLFPAMMGSVGLPLGLFWFAWTSKQSVSWASPVVAAVPFAWGNLSIFLSAANYLIDTYQALNGASALAANGLLRYTLGAVFPLFTIQMYKGLGIGWATSLLGFVTVALMPVPWVLFKYGKQIRARSSYDTLKV